MMQKMDDEVHHKLRELQSSVSELDGKISNLDDKVNHVIQMNGEMMVQSSENFREIKHQMEDQRDKLNASLRKLQAQTTTRCQMYGMVFAMGAWSILILYYLWVI
jgi:peptidoglycan hydrolase CwlO-like protein